MKEVSRQYLYQQKWIKEGKCRTCGLKRNKSKEFCDKHLKVVNKAKNTRYHNDKSFREKMIKRQQEYRLKKVALDTNTF